MAPRVRTYVALLRGINVGGHGKVPMADLRELLAGLGYTDVRTHLQSGNAVFRAPSTPPARLETAIAAAVQEAVGVSVTVLVRTRAELAALVEGNTLPTAEPSRLMVLFLGEALPAGRTKAPGLAGLDPADFAPEDFLIGDREIIVWAPAGILESAALKALSEKRLGRAITARNWNTVIKVLDLASALEQS